MADELCGKSGSGVKTGWANCAERVKALSNTAPSGMTVVSSCNLVCQNRGNCTDMHLPPASATLDSYKLHTPSVFVKLP